MAAPTNMTKQLKYTGKGYIDYKMQPVDTVAELKEKFKNNNELKLGLTVTVLNNDGDNVPVDYWYYFPYNDETESFDTSVAPNWYPKIINASGSGRVLWEDGGEGADFEAWKEDCVL